MEKSENKDGFNSFNIEETIYMSIHFVHSAILPEILVIIFLRLIRKTIWSKISHRRYVGDNWLQYFYSTLHFLITSNIIDVQTSSTRFPFVTGSLFRWKWCWLLAVLRFVSFKCLIWVPRMTSKRWQWIFWFSSSFCLMSTSRSFDSLATAISVYCFPKLVNGVVNMVD